MRSGTLCPYGSTGNQGNITGSRGFLRLPRLLRGPFGPPLWGPFFVSGNLIPRSESPSAGEYRSPPSKPAARARMLTALPAVARVTVGRTSGGRYVPRINRSKSGELLTGGRELVGIRSRLVKMSRNSSSPVTVPGPGGTGDGTVGFIPGVGPTERIGGGGRTAPATSPKNRLKTVDPEPTPARDSARPMSYRMKGQPVGRMSATGYFRLRRLRMDAM